MEHQSLNQDQYYAQSSDTQIKIRLDTEPLLQKIELFLTGHKKGYTQNQETGEIREVKIEYGKPLMNTIGVQQMMNKLSLLISAHTVQGNFTDVSKYDIYIQELNENLAECVVINCEYWGIQEDNLNYIIDSIIEFMIPFYTRLLNNEERLSYGTSFHTIETNRPVENRGWNPFRKND